MRRSENTVKPFDLIWIKNETEFFTKLIPKSDKQKIQNQDLIEKKRKQFKIWDEQIQAQTLQIIQQMQDEILNQQLNETHISLPNKDEPN